MIEALRAQRNLVEVRRKAARDLLDGVLVKPKAEKRNLHASEAREFDRLEAEIRTCDDDLEAIDKRIAELENLATRQGEAAEARRLSGGWHVTSEAGPYRPDDPTTSFFRDLRNAKQGDSAAAERLTRNHAAEMEKRAGDMTTVAGAGGQFSPPAWIVAEFVKLARPGRTTANLCVRDRLPSGVSSINLPKVASGTAVGVQQTQNTALQDTAMTTTSVSSGITTVGGKQIVALQLLNQSPIPFDGVILGDLAADYAKQLDVQVLYGSNANGQLNGLVNTSTAVAFTTTQPALVSVTNANSFYSKTIAAAAGIATTRYLPADSVVMHPNRCLEALDGQQRPLIAADGQSVNVPAVTTDPQAEGAVGTLAKLNVFVDPNISTTANSATNQDEVYVLRANDLYLWETEMLAEAFDATYADQASVLFRVLGWAAFIPNRYTASVAPIRGSGLVAPVL
jgi:HK97 family phage major capsid protein